MNLSQLVTDSVRLAMAHEAMSRQQLAKAAGMKVTALTARMIGRTPWTLKDLEAIARVFGIPATSLFAGGLQWIALMDQRDRAVRPTHGSQTKISA